MLYIDQYRSRAPASQNVGAPSQSDQSGTPRISTPSWPPTVNGDIAVLYVSKANNSAVTDPGGWTAIIQGDRGEVWWKTCDGTETGTINVSVAATNTSVISVFHDTLDASPVDVSASQAAVGVPNDITFPTVTPTTSNSWCIAMSCGRRAAAGGEPVVPGGTDPTYAQVFDSGDFFTTGSAGAQHQRFAVHYGLSTSTSALGDRTVQETGYENFYHGMTVVLKAL